MFKSASWRSEKKIKAVFIMQFQATQVPQLKAKKLMISLIPADVGKPTVRLGKAAIVEGTCAWENPIYETVKLVKEIKTGILKPKIYHFIASTGSSKSGYLGEASVDFAYLLEATKPVMLSLPLQESNSGAILHVTIQKLEGTLDQRCSEEDGSVTPMSYGRSLEMDLEDTDKFENGNPAFTEEKYDNITPHHPKKIGSSEVPQSENDTSGQDFTDTAEDMHQKFSSDSNQWLLDEIKTLERQAEVSELELQSLRKQILKESRKVGELSREIVSLKNERNVLKEKCEGQKPSPQRIGEPEASNSPYLGTVMSNPIPEEIRQELQREKQLNRKLRLQLQKTEDSNSELILAVRDLKEMLNKKKMEISHISSRIKGKKDDAKALSEESKPKMDQNEKTKVLENLFKDQREDEADYLKQKIENLNNEIELSRKEKEDISKHLQLLNTDYEILKKEKEDIYFDLQKKKKCMMEMQLEYTVSLDTVKQLRLQQENLEEEIKKQTLLSSKYVVEINDLETQVQSLEEELEKQAQDFEHDLEAVSQAKVEQEQRAKQAEETIEKVKRTNAKQVKHLKEKFTRTMEEMTFKIDENEKIASMAASEGNKLHLKNEHLEKLLQETKDELELIKNVYESELQEGQLMGKLSIDIDNKNTQFKNIGGHGTYEAQPTDSQMIKGERRRQEYKTVCNEEAKQKRKYEKEQKEMPYSESEILQSWSKETEELERELLSARKEAEKLFEENIYLRTLNDEKKRTGEILHLDMKRLSIHPNGQRHCSLKVDSENETLKSQVIGLKHDDLHNNKQVTRQVDDTRDDGRLEEGTGGENMCSRQSGVLKGNTGENGLFTAQRKSITTHAGLAVKMDSGQANSISDLPKLLNEVRMLKEQNEQKDADLKEMQERYSEISLRFAEVEGERQQLVMALRNLKNGKK